MLTAEQARQFLDYNPVTGNLTWKAGAALTSSSKRFTVGEIADSIHHATGYKVVSLLGVTHKSHRIIWLIMLDAWPTGSVDHINRNKADNTWCNLRDVTKSVNQLNGNVRRNCNSGVNGVSLEKRSSTWFAYYMQDYSRHTLYRGRDFFEAVCARKSFDATHSNVR